MDYQKLKTLISENIFIDIEHSNAYMLRVNYKPGDDNCWLVFAPENYKTEEEFAAAIKTKVAQKLLQPQNPPPPPV